MPTGILKGNLFSGRSRDTEGEEFLTLHEYHGVRIERIVSHGESSPDGFWYDQSGGEWVLLLSGAARVAFEGESGETELGPGDYLYLPPHARHRVTWTAPDADTVWLAVHVPPVQ
jgi:cupin 2 domain-containing protein